MDEPEQALDIDALLDTAVHLFSGDPAVAILTHAALAFCHVQEGKTLTFSTQRVTEGINKLFPSPRFGVPVEDHNVKRFILRSTKHPESKNLVAKMGAFIIAECIRDKAIANDPVVLESTQWLDFVEEAKQKLTKYSAAQAARRVYDRHFESIIKGVRNIVRNGQSHEHIYLHFFGAQSYPHANISEYKEMCYFLSYRYSVDSDRMVKTFLSVSTPGYNGRGVFEYQHVHVHKEPLHRDQHQRREDLHKKTLRKARGILVEIEPNYYFLGSSVRQTLLGNFPVYSEGIQVISIEKRQFPHAAAGLTALYLTNDNDMRPMIGRSALIALGNKTDIGRQTYQNFDLDVFEPGDFSEIRKDVAKVNNPKLNPDAAASFVRDAINLEYLDLDNCDKASLLANLRLPIRGYI